MPRVVAERRLDFDHVSAEVAERHRDDRPREDAREVDDEDVLERAQRSASASTGAGRKKPKGERLNRSLTEGRVVLIEQRSNAPERR
jgi:hypothetical protein